MKNDLKSDEPIASDAQGLRKPYVSPGISEVPLKMEEAVLGFCKTNSTAGPLQGTCNNPTTCSASGS